MRTGLVSQGVDLLARLKLAWDPPDLVAVELWRHRIGVLKKCEEYKKGYDDKRPIRSTATEPSPLVYKLVTPDGKARTPEEAAAACSAWADSSLSEQAEYMAAYPVRRVLDFDGTVYMTKEEYTKLKKQLTGENECADAYRRNLDAVAERAADVVRHKKRKKDAADQEKRRKKVKADMAYAARNDVGDNAPAARRKAKESTVAAVNAPARLRRKQSQDLKEAVLAATAELGKAWDDSVAAGNAWREATYNSNDSKLPPVPVDGSGVGTATMTITFSNLSSPSAGGQPADSSLGQPRAGMAKCAVNCASSGRFVPPTAVLAVASTAARLASEKNGWPEAGGGFTFDNLGTFAVSAPPRRHAEQGVRTTMHLGSAAIDTAVKTARAAAKRRTTGNAEDTPTIIDDLGDGCVVQ